MITIKPRQAAKINKPDAGEKTLFLDQSDNALKTKDSTGAVESLVGATQATVTQIAYTNNIPFTKPYNFMTSHLVSSNIIFTPNSINAVPGAVTLCKIVADGISTLTFTGIKEIIGSNYDNTANILNYLVFFYDGADYFVNIYQELNTQPVDLIAPNLQTAIISNSIRNRIVLTYNKFLNTLSTPLTTDFTVSEGKTVSSVTVTGSEVRINTNTNYAFGDVITISYVPGTNEIQDTSLNNAATLVTQAVTNNIAAPDLVAPLLSTATVEEAFDNRIILAYNENLNALVIPATTDFVVSGGKTVTNVSIVNGIVTLTVNSAYVFGDVITVSYTSGVNKLQDANGNFAANLVSQAVTNNISSSEITLAWEGLSNTIYTLPELIGGTLPSGGRATITVDAAQAFYVRTVVPTPATETNATVLYLDNVNTTNYTWNSGLVFRCGFYHYGGNIFASDGGFSAINTSISVVVGDWLQMIKSGNDVLLQKSTNAGGSWTTVYTFTGALTAQTTLYIKSLFATAEGQKITVTQG